MSSSIPNENWAIIENMIKKEGIASHHLNSYNEFLDHGIQDIIDEVGGIDVETTGTPYRVSFGKIYIGEPRSVELDGSTSRILPLETRLRDLAYSAPIHLEMTVEENGVAREVQKHHIGDIPIMIRSAKCETSKMAEKQMIEKGEDPFDPGGYFIVNGSERIIVGLEDLSPNIIEEKFWPDKIPDNGRKVVPLLPALRGLAGLLSPVKPLPTISTQFVEALGQFFGYEMSIPNDLRHFIVESTSFPKDRLHMCEGPCAILLSIRARCEIDLSPGTFN